MTPNIASIPVAHNKVFKQRDYLEEFEFDTFIIFDDETHQHNRLGKSKFIKKARERRKEYNAKLEYLNSMTWGTLLTMPKIRKKFEEIKYDSLNVSIPDSYRSEKEIENVGIFKYTEVHRFGGIFDVATQSFFIFWIDQKDNDIYFHA